jgi:hypothetical protein
MTRSFTGPTPAAQQRALSGAQTPQTQLAELSTYAEAERLVDRLSDNGFPVEHSRIVGTGLHTVEYVTGRLTPWLALKAGVASGAWFGLFVGLVLGLFTNGDSWFAVVVGAGIIGALWGAAFGWIAQRVTHGRRDFNSVQRLEADRYAVFVDAARSAEAVRLSGLP